MLRQIWFRWSDASDFGRNLRYHLGLQETKPTFRRFTYAEKIEYWALIWGTILMAVTGIMLWAKVLSEIICRDGGWMLRRLSISTRRSWRLSRSWSGTSIRYFSIPMPIP